MLIFILFFFYEKRWIKYLCIIGECVLLFSVVVWYWCLKFLGLEKKLCKWGIFRFVLINFVCSLSVVNSNWCVRSFLVNMLKLFVDKWGGVILVFFFVFVILLRSFLEVWLLRDNFEFVEYIRYWFVIG